MPSAIVEDLRQTDMFFFCESLGWFFGGFPQLSFTFVSKSPAVVWAFVYDMFSLGFL